MRNRVLAELSGGERQRVKIAIGLAQQPRLMLLDEPTQHMDLGRQIELMALLRRLVERGITIVAAVHDLALVRDNCTSAILLTPDAPAVAGPVAELLRSDLLERAFSVERPSIERYLATQPGLSGTAAPPSLEPKEAAGQQEMNEPPEHREHMRRPGEQLRCRGFARHGRSWRYWDHD